jgi:RNA polymerase sigma factor for flagellar operon FliA
MMPRRVYRELRALSAGEAMMSAYEEDDAAGPAPTAEAADARLTQYLAGLATAVAVGAVATPVSGGDGSEGVGREPSPEEAAIDRELFARVRTIVTQLPEAERTLIERHYFGEETLEQAASALGLSKSWGSRLHARAIETIARELKKQGSS